MKPQRSFVVAVLGACSFVILNAGLAWAQAYEPNDDRGTATPVAFSGQTFQAAIETDNDIDLYTVTTCRRNVQVAGQLTNDRGVSSYADYPIYVQIGGFDRGNDWVTLAEGKAYEDGGTDAARYTLPAAGTYYVRAIYFGVSPIPYTLTITARNGDICDKATLVARQKCSRAKKHLRQAQRAYSKARSRGQRTSAKRAYKEIKRAKADVKSRCG